MRLAVIIFLVLISALPLTVKAQFTFDAGYDATGLAEIITGQGVTILNAQYNGAKFSSSKFNAVHGSFGLDSGIVLSSGRISSIAAPNGSTASGTMNTAGDGDLDSYIHSTTLDAAVLEFDFIPQGDSLKVKYIFASDEYPQYNCSQYNDAFAFLISGPGISGVQNIALVPNTTIPVTINSINSGTVGSQGNLTNCTNLGSGAPFTNLYVANGTNYLAFNGTTVVLEATIKLIPCQTYHIKLAIADAVDRAVDSGVFIEAGSFSSNGTFDVAATAAFTNEGNNILVEGCKKSDIVVKRTKDFDQSQTINFTYSGTATYGVDYNAAPLSLTFLPYDTVKTITLQALLDVPAEADEEIIISATTGGVCSAIPIKTMNFYIKDSFATSSLKDTFVCSAFASSITAKFDTSLLANNQYLWNTGAVTQTIPVTTPGIYYVKHSYEDRCYNLDTFNVVSGDPTLTIDPASPIFCDKDSLLLTAQSSASQFLWSNNASSQTIYIKDAATYTIRATADNNCYVSASINTIKKPLPVVELGKDTTYCPYDEVTLNAAYPGSTYQWSTGAITATIIPKDSVMYTVIVTLNGCSVTDSVLVYPKKMPVANAGNDVDILLYGSAVLHAEASPYNKTYLWTPATALTNANISDPIATPNTTIAYHLLVTSIDGCIAEDDIEVRVINKQLVVPNAFSPNNDGINDTWNITLLESFINSKIEVFNRYGQLVYTSKGYNKPWDGKLNGKPLPIGTYYYIIDPQNGVKREIGNVTILR